MTATIYHFTDTARLPRPSRATISATSSAFAMTQGGSIH
jgi:hypothetical protein